MHDCISKKSLYLDAILPDLGALPNELAPAMIRTGFVVQYIHMHLILHPSSARSHPPSPAIAPRPQLRCPSPAADLPEAPVAQYSLKAC